MKNSVMLNGEMFVSGNNVISIGYNMKGNFCVSKSKLVIDNDNYFIVSGGLEIKVTNLSDFYIDTPVNRKKLKNMIK